MTGIDHSTRNNIHTSKNCSPPELLTKLLTNKMTNIASNCVGNNSSLKEREGEGFHCSIPAQRTYLQTWILAIEIITVQLTNKLFPENIGSKDII